MDLKEKRVEKNATNSMKIEIAVISAIVGTLILGRGLWQYVYPETHSQLQTVRQHQRRTVRQNTQLTREQLDRHTRVQQYLQHQRRNELKGQLRRDQERRLTQRLRQLHSSSRR